MLLVDSSYRFAIVIAYKNIEICKLLINWSSWYYSNFKECHFPKKIECQKKKNKNKNKTNAKTRHRRVNISDLYLKDQFVCGISSQTL